jgi:hypothetical protein
VPPEKFSDVAKYDGSVIVERTKGEMSALCDMEELNMLAINLANDVVTGKKSVSDARDFYAKTAMVFKQGKMDPYVPKLQFQPESNETATARSRQTSPEKNRDEIIGGVIWGSARLPVIAFHMQTGCTCPGLFFVRSYNERPTIRWAAIIQ